MGTSELSAGLANPTNVTRPIAGSEVAGETRIKVALVTGGSRGIGRAIALRLAKDGHDVALCYRSDEAAAREVAEAIRAADRRVFCQPCDVGDLSVARDFVDAAEAELGPLSTVVNCAGIVRDAPLVAMTGEAWREVIATNLDGVFNCCRAAVFGFMKRKRGCIVNVSSISGVYGNATQANYSASKAGVIGFSKALAKELGPYGVRVNVVAPGFIATDMTAAMDIKRLDKLIAQIPLRRIGHAEEVAEFVSFVASDRAAYITGQVLQIDGGLVL